MRAYDIFKTFTQLRKQRSLSQKELAYISDLSLATLQNIEAQKANPSLKTLTQLADIFDLELELKEKAFDWEELSRFSGLLVTKKPYPHPDKKSLNLFLKKACFHFKNTPGLKERYKEAFESLLLALKHHYPSFYKKHQSLYDFVCPNVKNITGRHIKLRRIALRHLGGYL